VLEFFEITEEQLTLPKWSDSGRCRGTAFIQLDSPDEVARVKAMDGDEFSVEGNTRPVQISDYVKNPPRRTRNRNNRRRRNDTNDPENSEDGDGNEKDGSREQVFEPDDLSQREIYVSNVPFTAEREDFEAVFGDCGEIEDITIPTIYSSGRPKGFAFVRFTTVEAKEAALQLNETTMIDRTLGVRENRGRAKPTRQRTTQRSPKTTTLSERPANCTTIFVGNLPWETDEKELKENFESCGEIRSARVVRQSWTGRSRGFGYVEFVEEASVNTAVQANVKIGGRVLRIDYAESEG